ncbi:MAG: flotillin domain-containing protein [Thiotrichaceae bacterium]
MPTLTSLSAIALAIGLLILAIFVLFYRRANKQTSFVRTGMGGERIIMDSGAMVFPLFHTYIKVNMQTVEIPIKRIKDNALITSDHLRVDIKANFFVHVENNAEGVSLAAQTMGEDTFKEDKVFDMFEERCEAALNAVVSRMTMDELHMEKEKFRNEVESFIKDDLATNGLLLQSVALTHIDQTELEYFKEQNVFDSQGLAKLKEQMAADKKKQVDIKTRNEIEIRELEYEAEKNAIDFEKQLVEEEELKRRDINKIKQQSELDIEKARITKEQDIELFLQEKNKKIALGQKHVAEIWIETDKLKAQAAKASEEVITSRERAQAERSREVEVISAEKEAERQRIIAEAAKDAEEFASKATQMRYQVEAAGKRAINEAANLLSNQQIDMKVKMQIVNKLPDIVKESVKPLENIEGIKIMHLDGLNAFGGNGGGGSNNSGDGGGGNGGNNSGASLSDQIVDSALRYKSQAPLVDGLLREIGIDGASISSISNALKNEIGPTDTDDNKGDDPALKESA